MQLQHAVSFRKGVAKVEKAVDADNAQIGQSIPLAEAIMLQQLDGEKVEANAKVIALMAEGHEVLRRLESKGYKWEGKPSIRVSIDKKGTGWLNVRLFKSAKLSAEEAFESAF